ncbi:MAG: FtsX-like permease family protein [Dehalococcoidales bacterium]|nr:FtsX-like permease family protein [Dehalococcoidales bacterium]
MLSPRWRKVLRDLLGNKTRTALVVLSIAVGVFAIGMIGGTQVVLSQDMRKAFLSISPTSATLYPAPFGDDVVEMVRHMPGVAVAEGRRRLTVQVQVGPEQKRNLQLTAIPDFDDIRINKIFPYSGAWPPGDRELLLERTTVDYLGLHAGGKATVELADGRTRELRIVGTAHDMYIPPPVFSGYGFGYVDSATLEWLGAPRGYNELNILVSEGQLDKQHIETVAAEVRTKLEKGGLTVYYTYVGDPGKHPVDSIMQAIVYLLGALGLVALILSGFLVVNTISALLTQQTRQIGVMKAVGARARQIAVMYLATVVAFGALALFVGVPLGALGAYWMGGFLASLINFDVTSYTPTREVLAVEVAVGLGVPLLAALYPIIAGTHITAREAMSAHGTGKDSYGNSGFDRLLERVRGLSRPMLLSLRNTFRRKGRLVLTLITLTLGGATFIAVFSVRESTMVTLDDALSYFSYDYQINFRRWYRADYIESEALRVPGVENVESLNGASIRRVRPNGTESDNLSMLSIDADTEMVKPILLAGRWLLPEDDQAVVLNTNVTQNEPDIKVGSELVFKSEGRETTWTVVGIVRGVMTGPIVYANRPYFEREMRTVGRTGTLWVRTYQHDVASVNNTIKAMKEQFEANGVQVGSTEAMAEVREMIQSQFDMLVVFLLIMAVLMAVVGGLGLMGAMSLNVLERVREIGVMRAIGASDGAVRQVFIVESVIIGIISWLVGAILALPISQLLSYTVGVSMLNAALSYQYSINGAVLWLAVVVILSLLASILPARSASRLSVREVLAYE